MGSRLISFLSILTCVFTAGQAKAAGSNIPQPASPLEEMARVAVPFDLYNGYVIVAHGSAGPLKGLNFFVDTGTSLPIFDSRIAQKLHLQEEAPASIVILGGRVQGARAILPSLGFGSVQRSNLPVVTADLSFFRKILPVRVDAIVGLDVVGQKAFVIDYSARVIRFGPPPAMSVSIPLRLDRGLATFDAEIDHTPVHLAFDTGAASLVLFNTAPNAEARVNANAISRPDRIVGDFARKTVRLHTVRLGDAELGQKSAIVVDNPKQSQLDFDGLVSPAALGIAQVSVDLRRGVLAFSR